MKLSNFRIRDRIHVKSKNDQPKSQIEHPNAYYHSNNKEQQKLTSLLQSFQNILRDVVSSSRQQSRQNKTKNHPYNGFAKDVEYRDRFVTVDLPQFEEEKIDLEKLQAWIGEVCDQSLSVAFNYFVEKKMSYDQMKAFASESLLRNLVILADNYKITSQQIRFLDHTINDRILPYLKAKYPLTIQKQLNKALLGAVKSIDNSQIVTNDYFFSSDICFEYRESGRYDDLIMLLLNEIMVKIDAQSSIIGPNNGLSNFKEFQNLMTQIFKKSFDQEQMNSDLFSTKVKAESDPKKKQKYQQKVKEYTSYLIGRKISQNTQMYSETEIKSQCMTIKSPTILRILTKWCDELWTKFEKQNYFMERTDGLGLIKSKKIGLVFPWLKTLLTNNMKQQKEDILNFLKNIQQINYKQQIELLENELSNTDCAYLERYKKISGKFACKIVNNVERFIIDYLNRLIHGLTTVSKKCYQQMREFPEYWPNPYNLITFNVSDLLRCKYSSRQKEVLKIFREIQNLANINPEKFKLIKIKNRLKNVTNDILIVAKLNNSLNCQIQISVNNSNSEFINCSNKINHYIYELQRSKFGPILEMCSIWKSCEKRSQIFNNLIKQEKPRKTKKIHQNSQCIKNSNIHNLSEQKHPFICSECSRHYYHSNFIVNHLKCKVCEYWKCANCLITQNFSTQNRDFFFKEDKLKDQYKFCIGKNQVPKFGACIFINQPKIEVYLYKKMQHNFKNYLIHLKNEEVAILKEVTSQKQKTEFFEEYLVFELSSEIIHNYLNYKSGHFEKNIISNLFIPEYIAKCLKQQKQTLSVLRQDHFSLVNFDKIFNENRPKLKCVESIQFSSTRLKKLDLLNPGFVNVKRLNLNINQISDISNICEFKKLQKIYISQNQVQQIPQRIGQLKELKQLDLFNNKIQKVPQSLTSLTHLTFLNLGNNQITQLPQSINQLHNLKQFILKKNKLGLFPKTLLKLKSVELINLQSNQICSIPQQIDELISLKELILSGNLLQKIPETIGKIRHLTVLDLAQNKIQQLPHTIGQLKCLQKLNLTTNNLKSLPDSFGDLQKLAQLKLSQNKIQLFNNCIFKLSNLTNLILSGNLISEMQDSFDKLQKLKCFHIESNKLKFIPYTLKKLPSLTDFKYHKNCLQSFDLVFYRQGHGRECINISGSQFLKRVTCREFPSYKDQIQEVNLSRNILEQFPDWVFEFRNLKRFILTNNKITNIPDIFSDQCKATNFIMNENLLKQIPASFKSLKFLQVLDLRNNKFESFPLVVCELVSLKKLELNKNSLKSLPNELKNLRNLEELIVTENQIEQIPDAIAELVSLWRLDLSSNRIKQIPLNICQQNSPIRHFHLNSNQIQNIPKQMNRMIKLLRLSLEKNPIKTVGDEQHLLKVFAMWEQMKIQLQMQNQTT